MVARRLETYAVGGPAGSAMSPSGDVQDEPIDHVDHVDHVEPTDSADPIDAWITEMLRGAGHAPESPAAERIRDELEEHIELRIRDLALAGTPQHEARRRVLVELGEADSVARGFHRARTRHHRRRFMHLATIGLGTALTAVIGVGIVTGPARLPAGAVVFEEPATIAEVGDWAAGDASVRIEESPVALGELLEMIRERSERPMFVEIGHLGREGIELDTPLAVPVGDVPIVRLMAAITESGAEEMGADVAPTWRIIDGTLELTTRRAADQTSTSLVAYDLTHVIARYEDLHALAADETANLAMAVIHRFVSPDDWEENGGDTARLEAAGDMLFVEAPARMHARLAWLLEQMAGGASGGVDGAMPAGAVAGAGGGTDGGGGAGMRAIRGSGD
jgi:hypothetical protein